MSRLRRKHTFSGILNADSEKEDKSHYNRCFRQAVEQFLRTDPNGESLPILREHRDPWSMNKDGKIRFDPAKYPNLMRK